MYLLLFLNSCSRTQLILVLNIQGALITHLSFLLHSIYLLHLAYLVLSHYFTEFSWTEWSYTFLSDLRFFSLLPSILLKLLWLSNRASWVEGCGHYFPLCSFLWLEGGCTKAVPAALSSNRVACWKTETGAWPQRHVLTALQDNWLRKQNCRSFIIQEKSILYIMVLTCQRNN